MTSKKRLHWFRGPFFENQST